MMGGRVLSAREVESVTEVMVVFGVKGFTRPEDVAADGEKDGGGDVESGDDDDEGENERGERGDDGEKEAAVDTGRASSGEGVDGVDASHVDDTRGAGWTSAPSSAVVVVVVVVVGGSGWGAGEAWRDRAERGGGGGPARLGAGAVLSASTLLLGASSLTLSLGVV